MTYSLVQINLCNLVVILIKNRPQKNCIFELLSPSGVLHLQIEGYEFTLRCCVPFFFFTVNYGNQADILFWNFDTQWLRIVEFDLKDQV